VSKKRKPGRSQPSRYVQQSIFGGFTRPRSDEAVQHDVMVAADSGSYQSLPPEIVGGFTVEAVGTNDLDAYGTASFCHSEEMPPPRSFGDHDICSMTEDTFREFTRLAMAAGFMAALQRYVAELKDVPELAEWRRAQKTGGDRGRETSSQRKEKLAERIRVKHASMERAGESCTYQAVANALNAEGVKCSRTTVERAINQRTVKRKKR